MGSAGDTLSENKTIVWVVHAYLLSFQISAPPVLLLCQRYQFWHPFHFFPQTSAAFYLCYLLRVNVFCCDNGTNQKWAHFERDWNRFSGICTVILELWGKTYNHYQSHTKKELMYVCVHLLKCFGLFKVICSRAGEAGIYWECSRFPCFHVKGIRVKMPIGNSRRVSMNSPLAVDWNT